MKNLRRPFPAWFIEDQRGQVLPWMALLMVLFLGMAGLTIDLGRAWVCYRELQASTDSAALAGAYAMTQSGATVASAKSEACSFSSNTNATASCPAGGNSTPNMTQVTTTPTLECVTPGSIVAAGCIAIANPGYNVIQVAQTAVIPTYFIQALAAFGLKSAQQLTLSATSTAAIQSGGTPAVNIAVIIDTTASMNDQDTDVNCGHTEIYCALEGLRTLMGELYPCTSGSSAQAGCLGAYDQVSLFTFPNIQANDAGDDTSCPTSNPQIPAYSYVPIPSTTNTTWNPASGSSTSSTYQITGYEDDYSANNQSAGGLNTSSSLGIASGANTTRNCSGLQAPGGDGTYIAGAMYAAITSLQAAKAANPNSTNALILLSDGGANSTKFDSTFTAASSTNPNPGTYPSTINQCQQTVAAGQYATSLGITVYTIAYGASSDASQCTTDTTTTTVRGRTQTVANVISPCTEMEETASSPSTFYSDATASEDPGGCIASTPGVGLGGIFTDIGATFLKARLVPNSVVPST